MGGIMARTSRRRGERSEARSSRLLAAPIPGGTPVWRGRWLVVRHRTWTPRIHAIPVPVSEVHHPDLHALVHDAAKRAGLDPPRSITLGGAGEISVRGNLLSVGL